MCIFFIDPSFSGISGDMLLGALIDLGGDLKKFQAIIEAVKKEEGAKFSVKVNKVRKKGITATDVSVESRARCDDLVSAIKALPLVEAEKNFSLQVAKTLIDAESKVHGVSGREIRLHELGSIDTLVDIVGTSVLANSVGMLSSDVEVYSSHVLVGKGKVVTEEGLMPVPPPAVLEILREYSIPFRLSTTEGELATPTGVSLLSHLATSFENIPIIRPEVIGIGAGKANLDFPNILRIVKGSKFEKLRKEEIRVLETSLDDVTGEVLGYTIGKLYDSGALDVQAIPTVTKKNRPGYILKVICKPENEVNLAELVMKETGSLGVRTGCAQMRFILDREIKTVKVKISNDVGEARVKISRNRYGEVVNIKPEYEDVRKIAEKTKMPLKDIIKAIEREVNL